MLKPYDDEIIKNDPLFSIRKQINSKEFRLRKMGYLQKKIICGLDLDINRLKALLIQNNINVVQEFRCSSIPFEYKDDPLDFIKKQVFKQWVKI